MTSSGPGEPPDDGDGPIEPARLRRGDRAVAAGTVAYLVLLLLPWFSVDAFDLGSGFSLPGVSVNGLDSGLLIAALVLLVLAAVWAVLPAVRPAPVPFPRALLTAGLAALAFVLTLVEWLDTLDIGFSLVGLLAFLTSGAVLAVALLRLLPELVDPGALPGGLARLVRWADRPAARRAAPPPAAPADDRTGEA
jgi:hypothetical protein